MVVPQNIRDLIIKHHNNGRSVRSIAQQLDIPKSTVNNILQHYMKTGSIQTNYIGRCGRPRRLSDREERTLSRASVINPVATARQLRATVGGRVASVSLSTIKRALTHQGRLAYRPRKSPSLNRAQQITRLRWCQQHSSWDIDKWMQVSFILLV
jgi:predicted ArsR family transcriptional regulator